MTDWHAGRILLALARHFDWWHNRMFTEYEVDGGRADLVFLSKAGYLTEVEIKISLRDWNADQTKRKFNKPRPHVSRFFYAIPETLENQIPDWLPESAGILVVRANPSVWGSGGYDQAHEIRAARRLPAQKLPESHVHQMHVSMYYRFWNQEIGRLTRARAIRRTNGA